MSTTPDSTLDSPQKIIADLKRQLAERIAERDEASRRLDERTAERDEALEQQTATAEVLGVINSSPGDLAPVFDVLLDKALHLSEAALGALMLHEGDDRHRIVAMQGVLPARLEFWMKEPLYLGPGTATYRQARGDRSPAHIADAAEHDLYRQGHPVMRAMVEDDGIRTWLAVPLHKGSVLLGSLIAFRREVRPFTDKQVSVLQNFAAQAVIAMENARLITETREALEQQTATAEVLQVINSSPGDLAPVFDAMLVKAMRLCDAAFGVLNIHDGEAFRLAAHRGLPQPYYEHLKTGEPYSPGGAHARLAGGAGFVHILDAKNDTAYPAVPSRRVLVDLGGARTVLAVPLRKDGILLGAFALYRQEVRPFSDKQIALLQNFAAQAVIAMENARLITETREALEQQTATAEVLGVINSSPGDLAPVFDAMLEKATGLCEASFGTLRTWDGERFHFSAAFGNPQLTEWARERPPFTPEEASILGRIVGGESLVTMTDASREPSYQISPGFREMAEVSGMRSAATVALRKDGGLLGSLTVYRQEVRPFTDKQIALLQNFAAQAVIAIENARLLTETREALEQQTATAEVLQVINSSPGDLVPVFDAILEKAHSLCGAEYGVLFTYDGELFWRVAMHGAPRWTYPERREGIRPGFGFSGLVRGEQFLHIHDMVKVAAQRPDDPVPRALVDHGIRTQLAMPLRKDGRLLGILTANRREVRPFSDKQIALLENFAAQAVIAMENARLMTETREALEQQTATAEVLGVINSSPGDLVPVFDAILEKAHTLCGAVGGGLVVQEGDQIRAVAVHGEPRFAEYWMQQGWMPAKTGSLPPLTRGEPIHIPDVTLDDSRESDQYNRLIELSGGRTLLIVPLRKDNLLLGSITAFRQEVRPFSGKQILLLQNFADQAVIAMENARLLGELRQRTEEVGALNRDLEARVAAQVDELGRVGRLKRFLAPQLAELIVSHGDEKILESHRREIVVVFCDLRGYTAFTETAEPEEVLDFLREYHGALGPLVSQFEGTLDQFSGDGIMVFFNDPVPCPDPAERAVKMAMAMREAARELIAAWSRHGCELGFGIGIAQGYATLGQIGFSERSGYTAIGTVCNLAARLCAEAQDGQILVSSRVAGAVGALARLEDLGNLELKGLRRPVAAFNVAQSTNPAEARPNLTVVTSAPGA